MTQAPPKPVMATLRINDQSRMRAISESMTLLDFLREELALTGTKRGCDVGECGCCTVLLDGQPTLACLTLALEAEGHEVKTIEGLASGAVLHPVQAAFVEHGALQCGFCTPAMVLNAVHLLETTPAPSPAMIKECIAGTICRCTGYTKIEEAVALAAARLRDNGHAGGGV